MGSEPPPPPPAQGLLEGMGLESEALAPMETDEPSTADPKAKAKITPAMAARIKQIKPLLSGEGGGTPKKQRGGVCVSKKQRGVPSKTVRGPS